MNYIVNSLTSLKVYSDFKLINNLQTEMCQIHTRILQQKIKLLLYFIGISGEKKL